MIKGVFVLECYRVRQVSILFEYALMTFYVRYVHRGRICREARTLPLGSTMSRYTLSKSRSDLSVPYTVDPERCTVPLFGSSVKSERRSSVSGGEAQTDALSMAVSLLSFACLAVNDRCLQSR